MPKRKQGRKGRPWPKGVFGNPSGKPSRLTKMGEELMREMFKPVDPEGLIAETASGSASDLVAVLDRSRFSVGKATLSVVYNCLSAARSRDRAESVDSHFLGSQLGVL